ncbi:hypothetical protein D3C73_1282880 [compost metagenome]
MLRIHCKTHIALPADHRQTRIIHADNLFILPGPAWLRLHLPLDSVIAEGQAEIRCVIGGNDSFGLIAVVIAEDHHIFPFKFCNPCIEYHSRTVRDIAGSQNRIRRMPGNNRTGE